MPCKPSIRDTAGTVSGLSSFTGLDRREAPPKQILGTRVVAVRDYLSDDQQSKERKRSAPAQASNVLRLVLQDGAELVVRPSGTEPKIKFYILVCGDTPEKRDALLERYASWINGLEIAR